jgi:hypothetical protein
MDNKKIIIIAILVLIVAGAIFWMLTSWVSYERLEITPNGTSLDVPANQTKFAGNVGGIKIWNWNDGVLVTHNTREDNNDIKITRLGYDAMNELIKNGEMQNIDGFTCYTINADELLEIHIFDIIKVNYNGKFYCIPLANETSHDNIIICCKDKDVALHMAKSVHYKNVYPNKTSLETAVSTVEKITGDLGSKANEYSNKTNLDNAVSSVEKITGDLGSKANAYVNGTNLNDVKSTIGDTAGDLGSKANSYINNTDLDDVKSTIGDTAQDLMPDVHWN